MTMIRRVFWGDVLLPKRRLHVDVDDDITPPQVHKGLDRDHALVLSQNDDALQRITVKTFWDPESTYHPIDHERYETLFKETMRARRAALGPMPLVEVVDRAVVVQTYVAPTVTCATAHGLSTNDWVLIRRSGASLYTLVAVVVTGANTFTIAAAGHAILAADDVLEVTRYWLNAHLVSIPKVSPPDQELGGGSTAEAQAVFLSDAAPITPGVTVTLD